MNFSEAKAIYKSIKANKKAQAAVLQQAPAAVVVLVVIAVILGVAGTILDKVQETQQTSGGINETSAAFNATRDGLEGITTFSSFQPTIAVIVVAVIVIGLLLGGFAFVQTRR